MTDQDACIVDVLLVHAALREKIELLQGLHRVYHPFVKKLGWDYGKTHHEGHEQFGIDPYIGLVAALQSEEGWKQL